MPKNAPPDPRLVAERQQQANLETVQQQQEQQNYNEITPFGTVSYAYPEGQAPTRTVELSPEQQALLTQQTALAQSLGNLASERIGATGDRARVEEAILSRLNPEFARDEERWIQRLASQGLTPGSEAYNREMQLLSQRVNDARMQAVLAGGTEQNRQINEALALAGYVQPTVPQFQEPFQMGVAPPAIDQYIWNTYNAQQEQRANRLGGLFGLAGTVAQGLFGLSDVRAKEDIVPVGETDSGIPLYRYRYVGDPEPRIGPIAQEVARIRPDAVKRTPSGLFAVDLAKVA